jgi:DNA-binding CsgD family transcriptional regulator
MIPKQTLSKWNRDLARAVAALGSDQFFPALVAAIQGQVRFDHPQVWLYHSDLPPRSLYNEVPEQALKRFVDDYRDSTYRDDPFYHTCMNQPRSRIYRLSRLTNGRGKAPGGRHAYHIAAGIVDEAAYVCKLDGGNVMTLALKRLASSGEFSGDEYDLLYLLAEPVAELMKYHSEQKDFAVTHLIQPEINLQIDTAFKTFGASLLSPREKDVLELMLRGYGTDMTAQRLDIALETVRRHRKSIYRKLDVNSQTDLFSLFINSMSCLGQAAGEDPLSIYMSPQ